MENTIKLVAGIRRKMHLGFPDGYNEEARRDLIVMMRRIEELERALVPFARLARIPFNDQEMLYCHKSDVINASGIMDDNLSVNVKVDDFGNLPA